MVGLNILHAAISINISSLSSLPWSSLSSLLMSIAKIITIVINYHDVSSIIKVTLRYMTVLWAWGTAWGWANTSWNSISGQSHNHSTTSDISNHLHRGNTEITEFPVYFVLFTQMICDIWKFVGNKIIASLSTWKNFEHTERTSLCACKRERF